jgi:hypothetical protein
MHGRYEKCIQNFSLKHKTIRNFRYISIGGEVILNKIWEKFKITEWTGSNLPRVGLINSIV